MRRLIGGCAGLILAGWAGASLASPPPLPKPVTPPTRAEKARTCHVGSFTGTMLPGTTVCAKVSGFVRVDGVSGGGRGPAGRP